MKSIEKIYVKKINKKKKKLRNPQTYVYDIHK